METIEKYLTVAVIELSKINFCGSAVIPAGKAMSALYAAKHELEKLAENNSKEGQRDG